MNSRFIIPVCGNPHRVRPFPRAQPTVHLPALVSFECVARNLRFARAAEELDVTATAISKTIKQLEAQLNARLFNRTTRSVALTEAGTKLLGTLAPALAQIRDSVQLAGDFSKRPHGLLRINTGYVPYAALIEARLASFGERYPEITLDITLDNNLSDIVAGGFDAGIRLGYALQRDVIAVPLGPMQQLTAVGSPLLETSWHSENIARTTRTRLHPSSPEPRTALRVGISNRPQRRDHPRARPPRAR
jgi:DNA-binding transcriptional LysR family regulator